MMKNKILLPALLATSLLTLSGCSLFNDDDLAYTNTYNTVQPTPSSNPNAVVVSGVEATESKAVPGAQCFKNIGYATNDVIKNTYGIGGKNHTKYDINEGKDYPANKSSNNYDLYIPKEAARNDKHTVILFVHGGAWVSGFKTDVNPYVYEFANRGYITATIKYTLLSKAMDNPSLSIFRNLDEIDACISSIKTVLGELGFDTKKTELVIGGASSGAHLSMLYTYSRGKDSPIPLQFVIDAVGPVDIQPNSWKRFNNATDEVLGAGIDKDAIDHQEDLGNIGELQIAGDTAYWNDYETMRIANGMCGLPFTLEEIEATSDEKISIDHPNTASESLLAADGGEKLLSVTNYISAENNFPIICAYGGKDKIVGINQYATLQPSLELAGVTKKFFYFQNCDHTEIDEKHDKAQYEEFVKWVDKWGKEGPSA